MISVETCFAERGQMTEKDHTLLPLNEPNAWSRQLVDAMLPVATVKTWRKGCQLAIEENGQPLCRMVLSGSVQLHRKADHRLITTVSSYTIQGLGGQNAIYLVTAETCEIATLTLEAFQQRIDELQLWEVFARYMVVVSNKIFYYAKILSAPTAYEMICNQLMELCREPLEVREKFTAERYIREKTHLSRSSIMKILADLRTGNYITIENGRLIEIKHLPQKY